MDTTELALVLPDGTRYNARGHYDEHDALIVDTATCGACGFSWNDALISEVTPTPAGRCPNEYAHEPELLPRKRWRFRGMGRYIVAQDVNGFTDVYCGANSLEGARKRRREVSHWGGAYIFDQARGERI